MSNPLSTNTSFVHLLALLFFTGLWALGCQKSHIKNASDPFLLEKNAAHNGDYFATYPLYNADSCVLRLKAEVPQHIHSYGFMSLWYRMPRTSPANSFRLLELYDQYCPHDTVFAFTQMVRGEFLVEMHQFDSARHVLQDARSRYLKLNRPLDASDADYLMARCYTMENKPSQALEGYRQVLELINRHDTAFSHRHHGVYMDISALQAKNKNFKEERAWLYKSWHGNPANLTEPWKYRTSVALRLSANYAKTNQFDSSLLMARLAADSFRAYRNKPLPPEFNYRMGFAYMKKGDCTTALPYLQKAVTNTVNSPNSFMKNQIEQTLGETYFCLQRLDSAEFYLRKGLATPDTGNLSAAYRRLGDIHALRGNYKAAYEAEKLGEDMFRRYYDTEKAAALAEFEARYENAQKEHQIVQMNQRQRIFQQQMFLGIGGLLAALVVAVLLYLRQRDKNKSAKQAEALAEARALLHQQALERSQRELMVKSQKLSEAELLLEFKNQMIADMEQQLKVNQNTSAEASSLQLESIRQSKILTAQDWIRFLQSFDERFPGLSYRLRTAFPNLTHAETRLFLLTKLSFESAEIAQMQGISTETVWRNRNRLRKKLGLEEGVDLDGFIQGF